MALTFAQAAWFMLAALPISLYVAYTDMKSLKIPNVAVYAPVSYTHLTLPTNREV